MTTATATNDQPGTPALRHVLVTMIGALIVAALIADGAFNLLDLAARHTFVARSSYSAVHSLRVDAANADVRLTAAAPGARLTVTAHVTEALDHPRRETTLTSAGQLHLTESCPLTFSSVCAVTYDIAIPSGIAVTVSSGDGDITTTGLATTASISLRSGDGNITALNIRARNVRLSSGDGDIDAQLATAPQQLEANSGDGDITLTVPNVPYAIHASSGSGTVSDSELQINPASARSINANSGDGNVAIQPAR